MLNKSEIERGLDMVVCDTEGEERDDARAALLDAITQVEPGLHQLDPNIVSKGGVAFLWEDLLELGDMYDGVKAIQSGFAPNELAKVLVRLLTVWRRMRKVRVTLTENQFRVLRAIKRGRKTVAAVTEMTQLDPDVVKTALESLKKTTYRPVEASLVEGDDGNLSTRF